MFWPTITFGRHAGRHRGSSQNKMTMGRLLSHVSQFPRQINLTSSRESCLLFHYVSAVRRNALVRMCQIIDLWVCKSQHLWLQMSSNPGLNWAHRMSASMGSLWSIIGPLKYWYLWNVHCKYNARTNVILNYAILPNEYFQFWYFQYILMLIHSLLFK